MGVKGDLAVATQVVKATVSNQVRSIAATMLALLVFLSFSYGSFVTATMLLLPVVMTSLILLGGMGWLAVPLGVATTMFAALAEGEGVNYTIPIISRYLDLRRRGEALKALRETLASGDPRMTHLLYIYAWPRILRGSTLVIEDSLSGHASDHMWLSFPRLDTFREVRATALHVMIPGTGMSYDYARGWVTPERYEATHFTAVGGRWYPAQVRTTNADQATAAFPDTIEDVRGPGLEKTSQ